MTSVAEPGRKNFALLYVLVLLFMLPVPIGHAQSLPAPSSTVATPSAGSQIAGTASDPNALNPPAGIIPNALPSDVTAAESSAGPSDVVLENADSLHLDENSIATALGNIKLRYRSYLLRADKVVIDTQTGIAVFTGNIHLTSTASKLTADGTSAKSRLTLNLKKGTYHIEHGRAVIPPEDAPAVQGLLLPLRISGDDIQSGSRVIDARNVGITTCDFPDPHYIIVARSSTIIPGKRLVARHVTLYRRNHPIITLPYLVLPLNDRYARQGITPEVGQSADEGYFIKFAEPYVLAAAAYGILRLDLMQYKGVGTGFDQSYTVSPVGGKPDGSKGGYSILTPAAQEIASTPPATTGTNPVSGATSVIAAVGASAAAASGVESVAAQALPAGGSEGGDIQLYHLFDQQTSTNEWTGSLTHNQIFFRDLDVNIQSQFQENSYLSSSAPSNSMTNQIALTRTAPGATTSLSSNIQSSNYGYGQSSNIATSFNQTQAISKVSTFSFKTNLSQYTTPSFAGFQGTTTQTVSTNFDFLTKPKGYSVEVQANTFSGGESGGQTGTVTGGVQRLPEVDFQTTPGQIKLLPQLLPALTKFQFDVGDYVEQSNGNISSTRIQFGLDSGSNTEKHENLTNSYQASFLQDFYGDDAARYVLQSQLGSQYSFQKASQVGLTFDYLHPYGYTPFLFDETNITETAAANLSYSPRKSIILTMATGFDFTHTGEMYGVPAAPWEDLYGQLEYKPSTYLDNVATATYDPNTGQLYSVTNTLQLKSHSGFAFDTAAQYIPTTNQFADINADLDVPIVVDPKEQAGYRIRAIAGYDGYTSQFEYTGLALTRSWHDWELSAIYQNSEDSLTPGATFYFNFRLKAFPGYEPFAVGGFGQGLTPGVGSVY